MVGVIFSSRTEVKMFG